MRDFALIFSNDIEDPERMLEVTKETAPYIDGIKIGITSSMVPSIDIYKRVKDIMGDKKVTFQLADYKVADIGFRNKQGNWQGTNEKIIRNLSKAGADYITVHTFPGLSSIEEAVETAHKHKSKVLTLPYMTHKGAEMFYGMPVGDMQKVHFGNSLKGYGIDENDEIMNKIAGAQDVTDVILMVGDHFGVDGFIGPGNNPEVLKQYRKHTDKEIWSPGFGRQDKMGRTLGEQIYAWAPIVGPNSAMIVGSTIYKAEDPAKAAKETMETRDKVVEKL